MIICVHLDMENPLCYKYLMSKCHFTAALYKQQLSTRKV